MKNILFVATQPQRFLDQCLFAAQLSKSASDNIKIKFFIGDNVAGTYKREVGELSFCVINPVHEKTLHTSRFKSLVKNKLKSAMSENMIKLVRKGVAFIKTTPLFGGKLKRSEEAFYHSFTARHKLVSEYVKNADIDVIFINGDRHLGDECVFLKVAEELNIPTVIPYLVDFADKERILKLGGGIPVVKRRWFVSEYVRKTQQNLPYSYDDLYYYPHPIGNVLHDLGIHASNPFVMGSGKSTVICLNNKYSADKYAELGVERQKIRIIGDISYDGLYRQNLKREEIKAEFSEIYEFDLKRKIIVIALPQLAEHNILTWDKHWKEIKFLISSLCSSGAEVLISLHPKMSRKSYSFLETAYRCRILNERLSYALPAADVFVATFSSTVVWSVLCGINTVVVDFYELNYKMYDFLQSIRMVRDKAKLMSAVNNALNSAGDFSEDWERLSRNEVFDGNTIRRYEELILEVCRK
ncbi:hypothetical protein ADMFC3_21460 [Geovibrio sp. ADMFC3]